MPWQIHWENHTEGIKALCLAHKQTIHCKADYLAISSSSQFDLFMGRVVLIYGKVSPSTLMHFFLSFNIIVLLLLFSFLFQICFSNIPSVRALIFRHQMVITDYTQDCRLKITAFQLCQQYLHLSSKSQNNDISMNLPSCLL